MPTHPNPPQIVCRTDLRHIIDIKSFFFGQNPTLAIRWGTLEPHWVHLSRSKRLPNDGSWWQAAAIKIGNANLPWTSHQPYTWPRRDPDRSGLPGSLVVIRLCTTISHCPLSLDLRHRYIFNHWNREFFRIRRISATIPPVFQNKCPFYPPTWRPFLNN